MILYKLGLLHNTGGEALGDFTWVENDMEARVRKLVIETDSLTAYKGLASLSQGDNQHGVLFKECKDLLLRDWIVQPRLFGEAIYDDQLWGTPKVV